MEKEEREEEPSRIIVDTESEEGSWVTDDSVHLSSEDEKETKE